MPPKPVCIAASVVAVGSRRLRAHELGLLLLLLPTKSLVAILLLPVGLHGTVLSMQNESRSRETVIGRR